MNVYAGIRRLTVVERWRRGRKLIPWHWNSEALEALSGTRADCARADLLDTVLKPALATALRLGGPSDITSVQIHRATFAQLSISFEVKVLVPPVPAATDGETLPSSLETAEHTVQGIVRNDLSVSIAVTPTA